MVVYEFITAWNRVMLPACNGRDSGVLSLGEHTSYSCVAPWSPKESYPQLATIRTSRHKLRDPKS